LTNLARRSFATERLTPPQPEPVVHAPEPVVVHAVVHAPEPVVHAKRSGDRHKPTDARRAYKAAHERRRRAAKSQRVRPEIILPTAVN
jgi:hypothetical protein